MKGKAIVFGLCAMLIAGAAQAEAPLFDMKPGLWEVRILKMEQNGKDMLTEMKAQAQQALAHLSPEQRKQLGGSMMGGDMTTSRMCVSPAMAKSWLTSQMQNKQKSGCAPPKVNRDGNRATFETTCEENGATVVSKGVIVSAGDQITIQGETVTTGGSDKQTTRNETQMRFIGSDCGDIKPLDEMVKQMHSGATGAQGQHGK